VYGPVRTVVWQGSAGNRRPYADLPAKGANFRIADNPDRILSLDFSGLGVLRASAQVALRGGLEQPQNLSCVLGMLSSLEVEVLCPT